MAALVVTSEFDFSEFFEYVHKNLPSYSRPVFVRLTPAIQVTGTFKHQKVQLRSKIVFSFREEKEAA